MQPENSWTLGSKYARRRLVLQTMARPITPCWKGSSVDVNDKASNAVRLLFIKNGTEVIDASVAA